MKNTMNVIWPMIAFFVFWIGILLGNFNGKHIVKTDAVENGFAEWAITVEPNGKVHKEFKWIKK